MNYNEYFRSKAYKNTIVTALGEDAVKSDITLSSRCFRQFKYSESIFNITVKQECVISGLNVAMDVFRFIAPKTKPLSLTPCVKEGASVKPGTCVLEGKSTAGIILSAERTALNFLSHLSGVSTLTNWFVKKAAPFKVRIFDTRKTTPGLRMLEKYAVSMGGGRNHRLSLADAIFIKDNHRLFFGKNSRLFDAVKNMASSKPVIIEVESEADINLALKSGADVVLLDNFTPSRLKKFLSNSKISADDLEKLEATGRVNPDNILQYLQTGIKRISIGYITHSAPNIDFSLDITKKGRL